MFDGSIKNARAFTLIELVVVIGILAAISYLAVKRFDSVSRYKQNAELRKFVNTWQFVRSEAVGRKESYRLIIDVDAGCYSVKREIIQRRDTVTQVDYLKNFRSEEEQERKEEREKDKRISAEEQFEEEDYRQTGSLETLFFEAAFADPYGSVELRDPLEFPSLSEEVCLSNGIFFRNIKVENSDVTSGETFLRFSPQGAATFAVVKFDVEGEVYTAVMNPSTGQITLQFGDVEYKWLLDEKV